MRLVCVSAAKEGRRQADYERCWRINTIVAEVEHRCGVKMLMYSIWQEHFVEVLNVNRNNPNSVNKSGCGKDHPKGCRKSVL